MICVGIAALIKAMEFPKQSQMMPYVYSFTLIILSLFLGVKALRNRGKVEEEDSVKKEEPLPRVLLVLIMIFMYVVSIQALGFYSSTMLFLFIFMGLMKAAPIFVSLVISVATSLTVYFLFETFLNVPVPKGMFF